jgi:hypothetical protein
MPVGNYPYWYLPFYKKLVKTRGLENWALEKDVDI